MVSYLQVQNITRRVGDRTLFQNLSFSIAERQKVGLIAQNGTGKSTLLNILAGKDTADEGNVIYHNDLRIGYLEQAPHYPMDMTVLEACFWHGNETTNLIREYEHCMATPGNPGLQTRTASYCPLSHSDRYRPFLRRSFYARQIKSWNGKEARRN